MKNHSDTRAPKMTSQVLNKRHTFFRLVAQSTVIRCSLVKGGKKQLNTILEFRENGFEVKQSETWVLQNSCFMWHFSYFIGRRWPTCWQFPLLVHERYLHLHLQSHVTWFDTWRVPEETWYAVRSLSIYISLLWLMAQYIPISYSHTHHPSKQKLCIRILLIL